MSYLRFCTGHSIAARGMVALSLFISVLGCPKHPQKVEEFVAGLCAKQPLPEVAAIEVTTPEVFLWIPTTAAGPAIFALEARLWDDKDHVIPCLLCGRCHTLTWHSTDNRADLVEQDGHTAVFELSDTPQLPDVVEIWATVDDVQSSPLATVRVIRPTTITSANRIVATHADKSPASAFVANRLDAVGDPPTCLADQTVAFVRSAPVGDLLAQCEEGRNDVAVFSTSNAVSYQENVNWPSESPSFDLSTLQTVPRELEVAVWLGVPPEDSDSVTEWTSEIQNEVELANEILERNRVGVRVVPRNSTPDIITISGGWDYNCEDDMSGNRVVGMLNVYYVKNLAYGKGVACPGLTGPPKEMVFISRDKTETTLIHEIGHALALRVPREGHTWTVAGFAQNNIMWGGLDHLALSPRDHLSLGQAFRMNMDQFSWLNFGAGKPGLDCQCLPYSGVPCARLATDFVPPPSGSNTAADRWRCSDEMKLKEVSHEAEAVALLHGRTRTLEPQDCEWVPGTPGRRASEDYLRLWFPNLVAAHDCVPQYAVFFNDYRMWHREITEVPWTNEYTNDLELKGASDVPQPRVEVPVHVWVPTGESSVSVDGVWVAKDVYSGTVDADRSNRVGVDLKFVTKEIAADLAPFIDFVRVAKCDTSLTVTDGDRFQAEAINVYHDQDAGALTSAHCLVDDTGGKPFAGTGFIVLPADPSDSDLSHELGHVFGLGNVSTAGGFGETNVMLPTPTTGTDNRKHLTLGQVFRINLSPDSWLKRSPKSESELEAVDCNKPTVTCPPLKADVVIPE